jgi:hypothetical protein
MDVGHSQCACCGLEQHQSAIDQRMDRDLIPRSTLEVQDKMLEDRLSTMEQDIRYIKDVFMQKVSGKCFSAKLCAGRSRGRMLNISPQKSLIQKFSINREHMPKPRV